MQGTPTAAGTQTSRNEKPSFRLFIAYEDFATGKKAQSAAENMARSKQPSAGCQTVMWKFDLLRVPGLRALATEDALQADVILLSMHGASGLPGDVKSWISEWLLKKRNHPRALALMLDCDPRETSKARAICAWMRKAARKGRFDLLFCTWFRPRTCSGLSPTTLQVKGKLAHEQRLFRWQMHSL
jgi:hypothetical protein